jgi:hypothetical protein
MRLEKYLQLFGKLSINLHRWVPIQCGLYGHRTRSIAAAENCL